jgi:hypothetical protein
VYLNLLIPEGWAETHLRLAAVAVGFSHTLSDNAIYVTTVYSQFGFS